MSRIGKIPVSVPKNVKAAVENATVNLEGPKGKLSLDVPEGIKVEQKESELIVTRKSNTKPLRAKHGTVRALLWNMVVGVTEGHKKELEVEGLGFRVQVQGQKLTGNLGLSHPVEYTAPDGVKLSVAKSTAVTVEGIDRVLVGRVAADIRDLKPAEPYKGKGIKYAGEVIRRKQGKAVTK